MTSKERGVVVDFCRKYIKSLSRISFDWLQDLQSERENRRNGDPDSIYSELTDEMLEEAYIFVRDTDDALDTVKNILNDIFKESCKEETASE